MVQFYDASCAYGFIEGIGVVCGALVGAGGQHDVVVVEFAELLAELAQWGREVVGAHEHSHYAGGLGLAEVYVSCQFFEEGRVGVYLVAMASFVDDETGAPQVFDVSIDHSGLYAGAFHNLLDAEKLILRQQQHHAESVVKTSCHSFKVCA